MDKTSENNDCSFCDSHQDFHQIESRIILKGRHWFVIMDNYPGGLGHALSILMRHDPNIFGVSWPEWKELQDIIEHAKRCLDEKLHPNGYNIGVNCGEDAGQTVFHLHIHLIPRYKGDVENPRGGIRNFKKPPPGYPELTR